ncbi:MAG: septum formation initiator family protein [bacterium]|nr:septum formation initiator family protein [bacterium]MDD5353866.1 septum formation initiator family protein [bacterium]MDD5756161.1 septum formation initiator family protein [bacterium]
MTKIQKQKLFFWLVIGLVILVLVGNKNFWRLLKAYRERASLQLQIRKLDAENKALQKKIYNLEHNDQEIEKIAREELGMTKPGEIEYRVKKQVKK